MFLHFESPVKVLDYPIANFQKTGECLCITSTTKALGSIYTIDSSVNGESTICQQLCYAHLLDLLLRVAAVDA